MVNQNEQEQLQRVMEHVNTYLASSKTIEATEALLSQVSLEELLRTLSENDAEPDDDLNEDQWAQNIPARTASKPASYKKDKALIEMLCIALRAIVQSDSQLVKESLWNNERLEMTLAMFRTGLQHSDPSVRILSVDSIAFFVLRIFKKSGSSLDVSVFEHYKPLFVDLIDELHDENEFVSKKVRESLVMICESLQGDTSDVMFCFNDTMLQTMLFAKGTREAICALRVVELLINLPHLTELQKRLLRQALITGITSSDPLVQLNYLELLSNISNRRSLSRVFETREMMHVLLETFRAGYERNDKTLLAGILRIMAGVRLADDSDPTDLQGFADLSSNLLANSDVNVRENARFSLAVLGGASREVLLPMIQKKQVLNQFAICFQRHVSNVTQSEKERSLEAVTLLLQSPTTGVDESQSIFAAASDMKTIEGSMQVCQEWMKVPVENSQLLILNMYTSICRFDWALHLFAATDGWVHAVTDVDNSVSKQVRDARIRFASVLLDSHSARKLTDVFGDGRYRRLFTVASLLFRPGSSQERPEPRVDIATL
mmetsp:Transcript_19457/g.33486  ORF Transcript_19457/g.33486 Transcript_19457/m.33486 type:complete len:547 (-) Transcript_19457:8-1648(-)